MSALLPGGILNLHKPSGPTSHDCVQRVRRRLKTRRVGHAGTLDPLASGVLLLGVDSGTRVLEYLQGLPKTYRARIRFGVTSDTQDSTGRILSECDASSLTESVVTGELAGFEGEQQQLPPLYSALKRGGRPLYDYARKGEEVERTPRTVNVQRPQLLSFSGGAHAEAEFRCTCSAGTYVRTLCHDLGDRLGVGGVMTALVRESIGRFRLEDAVPLDLFEQEPLHSLIPLAEALSHLPACTLDAARLRRLAQGQYVPVDDTVPDGEVRVLDAEGALAAVGRVHGRHEARLLAPGKVFLADPCSRTAAGTQAGDRSQPVGGD